MVQSGNSIQSTAPSAEEELMQPGRIQDHDLDQSRTVAEWPVLNFLYPGIQQLLPTFHEGQGS